MSVSPAAVKAVWERVRFRREGVPGSADAAWSGAFRPVALGFLSASERERVVRDAQRLCDGEYQIFNYPPYRPVRWDTDPVSGLRLKKRATSQLIRVSALFDRADVKNYWEQSHLHGFLTLAEAYAFTAESRFADAAAALLLGWLKENPADRTVAWKCQMDNAIRLANIVCGLSLLSGSQARRENEAAFAAAVREHLRWISRYYENTGAAPNNHYLSDLVGVIWGSAFLVKELGDEPARGLLADALARLQSELARQIHKDGSDYENSVYYHCFVTELVAETAEMLRTNGLEVPADVTAAAERMLGACAYYGAFDAALPLFGDQDGSRLFLYGGFFDFDRCDFSSLARFTRTAGAGTESGIYRFEQGGWRVYVKCGPIGTAGKGTHDHNDQLAVCVYRGRRLLVTDGGTYLYTSDCAARRLYRSEAKHSTVSVQGLSQNDVSSDPFAVPGGHGGTVTSAELPFAGEFTYADGTVHTRRISFDGEDLLIEDEVTGDRPAEARYLLPETPDAAVEWLPGEVRLTGKEETVVLTASAELRLADDRYAPAYGVEAPCKALLISAEGGKIRCRFSARNAAEGAKKENHED